MNAPAKCLGSKRIAKRTVDVMKRVGLDVQIFKAHSLRGATATKLLRLGVPKNLVRARGGWKLDAVLDEYDSRFHQQVPWEEVLLGETAGRGMSLGASSSTTTPQPEGDEGNRRGGVEEGDEAPRDILTALAVLRPLYTAQICAHCEFSVRSEAAISCTVCHTVRHVRCMGPRATPGGTEKIMCNRCATQAASVGADASSNV